MPEEHLEESYEVEETPRGTRTRHTVRGGDRTTPEKRVVFRVHQIIWYILGVVEVILILRFILKLTGANAVSAFVDFVYSISHPLAAPFFGIFGVSSAGDVVFEWTTLVAMLVYALVAWGLIALFRLLVPATAEEVEEEV
jgi:hypothetical protein